MEKELKSEVKKKSLLSKFDDDMRNKIILISIVVLIFVISVGLVAWVVIKESFDQEDVVVNRYYSNQQHIYVAENEHQEELLTIKSEIEKKESDIEDLYEILNDKDADSYGDAFDE